MYGAFQAHISFLFAPHNGSNMSASAATFLIFGKSGLLVSSFRVCHNMTIYCFQCLTAKLLKQGYRYHKLRKEFSKFYRRHFELIEKYHVSLKKLMQQGICNPEFYGDLVYKFKKIIGNPNFSNLLKRIVNRFKRAGYSLDIMRQTAFLVFNPIMVEG